MSKFDLVKTADQLAEKIADHVLECVKSSNSIGRIKFAVEDTPSADDFIGASKDTMKDLWDSASGIYGIHDVGTDFDAQIIKLVGAYYGGNAVYAADSIDTDTPAPMTRDIIKDFVLELLTGDDLTGNILIRFDEDL